MTTTVFGIKPGDVIQNTYEIESLLGEGGMGATFKGRNLATDHLVAIKVMTPDFARNENALKLFKRESSLLRTVQNDAVIRYETTLQDSAGRLFLVMEYVDGRQLKSYIEKGARLASEDVLKLGARLADGLQAIHTLNIVHRDIAPDNILVPEDDIFGAKLIDFGLASNTIGTDKSIIGDSVAGKFSFMAPEQMGLFGGKASAQTDFYALGLVLMSIAGVAVPGAGMGMAALDARRQDIKISNEKLSKPLVHVLESMLRADPNERPIELVSLFQNAIAGKFDKTAIRKKTKTNTPSKQAKSRTLALSGIAAVALLGAGVGGYSFMNGGLWIDKTGPSTEQASIAKKALASDDALSEIRALLSAGGEENLNAALGAMMKLSNDTSKDSEVRQEALIKIAQMYDPQTYSPSTSPFARANPKAAKRFYQKAVDLGSDEAQQALSRLESE